MEASLSLTIVLVILKFIKCYVIAKCKEPVFPQELRQGKMVIQVYCRLIRDRVAAGDQTETETLEQPDKRVDNYN